MSSFFTFIACAFALYVTVCIIIYMLPDPKYSDQEFKNISLLAEKYANNKVNTVVVQQPKSNKSKFTQQFTAGETVDSNKFSKRAGSVKKREASKPSMPSNIKEFTLPDGSVIHINTDKTEMEVNDASDYFK